jgi:hypothetical protein
MRLRQRIAKLEQELPPPDGAEWGPQTDEEWLGVFEAWGRLGYFAGEPDFPAAVAYHRQTIQDAARSDPPFYPPDDFLPGRPENERRRDWRRARCYPDVDKSLFWLYEMYKRVRDGKPPVTEVEYRQLEQWFCDNEHRVPANEGLDIGGGRRVDRTNLRYSLRSGPRGSGATEVVEDLRALRGVLG